MKTDKSKEAKDEKFSIPPAARVWKKATIDIKSPKKDGPQEGIYIGKTTRRYEKSVIDSETGEIIDRSKDLETLILRDFDNEDVRLGVFVDGGLRNALSGLPELKIGDALKIVFLGEKELKNGGRCNTYDIFVG